MIRLSKEQVILLHKRLIETTGGSDGIRDIGMLDSALANPFQSFGNKELYPSVQAKAAQLCFGIVKNHPMIDGNKRLGAHVMLVFLALNGYELVYTQQELSGVILDLASGKMDADDILQWIISHQK
ncbi:MAG: type II toxin-antitoxin system death-on-curing family toxin [Lachnospiraceae bacterium]